MSKTKKINKKKLREISAILALIIIIIVLFSFIRKTLSRYQSDVISSVTGMKVAFYVIGDDYQSKNILIDEIYPSDTAKTFDFSVSNYEDYLQNTTNTIQSRISQVNTEFDIEIKATTNMPITYSLFFGDQEIGTSSIVLENGVYIQKITAKASDYPTVLFMGHSASITKTFTLKINFPTSITTAQNGVAVANTLIEDELSDLVDVVNISVTSRQKIN